jgi:hypothetical protein
LHGNKVKSLRQTFHETPICCAQRRTLLIGLPYRTDKFSTDAAIRLRPSHVYHTLPVPSNCLTTRHVQHEQKTLHDIASRPIRVAARSKAVVFARSNTGSVDSNLTRSMDKGKKKGKDIPVTGHGGPLGCERLRLPHYLDKRLIDGGKVVSPTRQPHFTPSFFIFKDCWYSFLLEAESTPGP